MPIARRLGFLLLALSAGLGPAWAQDHTYSTADVTAGVRIYGAQCQLCHGPNGDMVNGVDLRRGRFKRAVTDEDLAQVLASGVGGGAMPAFSFSADEARAVIALIRAGFDPNGTAVKVGNIDRGRALFAGKGGCATCHRAGGAGPRTAAPDLSDIGAVRTPAALQRALLEPTSGMLPINRPVVYVLTDKSSVRGRRVNEDTFSIQVVTDSGELKTLEKSRISSVMLGKASPMPPATKVLTPDEIADVVGYLLSLRGAQ
ncbi:MAG: c-type cytochrome [Vicinamibacterales bacterium]